MRMAKRPDKCEPTILRDILLLASVDVPLSHIREWTPEESALAEEWANKSYLRASDNPVRVPPKPEFLKAYPKVETFNRETGSVL